jgi:hypothetical protein
VTTVFLLLAEADDFDGVADLHDAALDTAGGDGAAALDREDVFDGHEEGLVDLAGGLGDVAVDGLEEVVDGLADLVVLGVLEGGLGLTADDRGRVAGEAVLLEQLADFELDEVEELGVVDEVDLVEEDDDVGHTDLTGEQDVLAGLGHGAVGGRDDEDRAVHLGGAGDHVLDEVGVAGAVDVSVVTLLGLVLGVRRRDGHGLVGVADRTALGDVGVGLDDAAEAGRRAGREGGGERRLAVVDVADGADVDVRVNVPLAMTMPWMGDRPGPIRTVVRAADMKAWIGLRKRRNFPAWRSESERPTGV